MTWPLAIALYLVCWWLVLFAILPFGVHTQSEAGEVSPGTAESAPVHPRLLAKLIATTIVSGVVYGLVFAAVAWGIVDLDTIPLPRF